MFRKSAMLGILAVIIGAGGWLFGQDDKPARGRKALPTYWTKIGLSDEQKQKVYAIQAEYGAKIDALQQQLKAVQRQERVEMEKVLTNGQKARLREIVASKVLVDPGKDEKKPDEKKK